MIDEIVKLLKKMNGAQLREIQVFAQVVATPRGKRIVETMPPLRVKDQNGLILP